ncbi:hypothetical protein [Streptomyces malaysiense]|uniref:Uncharacterized protein n=1 Tax=Streptomyces malaysiense TaxID=1428626 RepID=A0A1J4Q2U3_9ACTN|nr:hypothetical protein [Streptomyces malaysiense]OIK26876.1 hypothetical protein VT52_014405 [Streptomyces malaysiense]
MNPQQTESAPAPGAGPLALAFHKFALFASMSAQANPGIAPCVPAVGEVEETLGAALARREIAVLAVSAGDVLRADAAGLGGHRRFPGAYVGPACPELDGVPAARLIGSLSGLIVPHGAVLLAGPERCGEIRELLASCGLHDSDDPRAGTHLLARKKDVCCHDRDQEFHDRSAIWFEG